MQEALFGGQAIVADDRAAIRDAVRSALGSTWYVFPASNGIEAVAYARTVKAALVILDIRMDPLNGIDAGAQIRHLPNYSSVPLVILTGYGDEENRRRAKLAGVDRIVTKPFTPYDLVAAVRPLLVANHDDAAPTPDKWNQADAREILAACREAEAAAARATYDSVSGWRRALRRDRSR